MSKKSLIIVFLILAAGSIIFYFTIPVSSVEEKTAAEYQQLSRDIEALNLLNSLYLTKEQVKQLIPVIREAKSLDGDAAGEIEAYRKRGTELFREMKKELSTNIDLSDSLKDRYGRHYHDGEVKKKAFVKRMDGLIDKAENILNRNQKIILSEYVPCHVPQTSVTHPERIGQAADNSDIIRKVSQIRFVSDDKYNELKPKIEEKVREKLETKVKDPAKREEIFNNVMTLLEKSRSMSDEQFEIEKDGMIDGIRLTVEQKEDRNEEHSRDYIRRFLLNPGVLEILEKKI